MENKDSGWDGNQSGRRPLGQEDPKIELTAEDMKVLRQCNVESFWYRSFPFAAGLSVLAHLGVRNGYLRPNARFGSTPKVLFATVFGYVIGKISYRNRCAEMIMELPNSQLAEALRRNRNDAPRPAFSNEDLSVSVQMDPTEEQRRRRPSGQLPPSDFSIEPQGKVQSDEYHQADFDLSPFQDRPMGPSSVGEGPSEAQPSGLSYDELRRRNREEHETRRYEQMKRSVSAGQFPVPTGREAESFPDPPPRKDGSTNAYGDVWDK